MKKGFTMKKQLQVSLVSVNDAVRFQASAPEKESIVVDYFSPPEDKEGYTSLELLLISAASCLATVVKLTAASRLKKSITAMEVKAVGIRRDEFPTDFTKISIDIRCISDDLDQAALEDLIRTGKKSLCPVFAMLKDEIDIQVTATAARSTSDTPI
jgi:putative redox protein